MTPVARQPESRSEKRFIARPRHSRDWRHREAVGSHQGVDRDIKTSCACGTSIARQSGLREFPESIGLTCWSYFVRRSAG